ncbi:MAG: glycosyltransferase, partial [candidate division Zixibacteria bacterium]|nr:glycosyltransferase [candidate division Zixibacteria bacterium]
MPGKRILVLSHNFIRFPEDPAGQFLYTLYRGIEDSYDIYILCPHQEGLKSKEKMGNLNIVRFKYWLPSSGENLAYTGDMQEKVQESIFGKIKFVLLILLGAWAAIRLVFSHKIDIIHAHWWIPMGVSAWLASKFTGRRLIITSHGTDIVLLEKGRYLMTIAQKVYNHASHITAVSSYLKGRLTEFVGIVESKISVFPMPFDISKFETDMEYSSEKGYILSVGRLNYRKGYDFLIRACKILQDDGYEFKLDVIGEGPRRKHLQELIESLGLNDNVRLIGSMPHNKV